MRLRKNVVFQRLLARLFAEQVGIAVELRDGYEQARVFLDPVLGVTISDDARWDAAIQHWVPS